MGTYFKNIWLGISTALVGMRITIRHLFGKKVTNQYPEKYHPIFSGDMPKNSRNRLAVDMDNCDGCQSCVRACPVNCIKVEIIKATPDQPVPDMANGKSRKTWVSRYDIDFGLCCFCSLCTEACPTSAIKTTQEFEYSTYDRESLKYKFSKMTEAESADKKKRYAEYAAKKKAEEEAQKAAEKPAES